MKQKRPPRKLLFSATLSHDPEKLQKLSLFQPKLFTSTTDDNDNDEINTAIRKENFLGKYVTPKELTEKYIICSINLKPLVLYKFIKMYNLTKTLIFTHSLESVHRLAILLRKLFENEKRIEEMSSNLNPKNRETMIEKFSGGEIDL